MIWDFKKYQKNIAIIDENQHSFTYEELSDKSNSLAKQINKRCLVFCLCKNSIGSLFGYIGFLQNNIVPLMIQDNINQELYNNLLEIYQPDFIYLAKNSADYLKLGEEVYDIEDYILLKTKFEKTTNLHHDLALLITTSGSTGSPKLVRQSYKNITSNTKAIVKYLELNENDRTITTLPMNYSYGISVINTHLFSGGSIFLTNKTIMQREFWHQLQQNNISNISGVPYTYEIFNKLKFRELKLPKLRLLTQAGGKLSNELQTIFGNFAKENNIKFIVMYGQTEATARMSYLPYENCLNKIGSIGIAIPNGSFSIIDEKNNEINQINTEGELVYKGENVSMGYANNSQDLAKDDELNGVLNTGDIAKFDQDGYFFITGRKKRFVKIFGNRINLDEIESLIKSKFKEIDLSCGGFDDKIFIFIINQELKTDIANFIRDIIKINPIAFKIKIIDEIPKNESGKIKYKDLEKYYD